MKLDLTGYKVRHFEGTGGRVYAVVKSGVHTDRTFRACYTPEGRRLWQITSYVKPNYRQTFGGYRMTWAGKDTERQLEAFVAAQEVKL